MSIDKLIARIGTDKFAHFFGSAFIVLAAGRFLPIWAALTVAAIADIAKELYDAKKGRKWDWKDILADAIGVTLGAIILLF